MQKGSDAEPGARPSAARRWKRRAYVLALPLGAAACATVWSVERARGTLHAVDAVGMPVLAAGSLALTAGFVVFRDGRGFAVMERAMLAMVLGFLLASQAHAALVPHPAGRDEAPLGDLPALGYWFPVAFALALAVLGVRAGATAGGAFFAMSAAMAAGHAARGLDPVALYELVSVFSAGGISLLLMIGSARVLQSQVEAAAALGRAARTDALTSLENRRSMEERIEGGLAALEERGEPFSVVLFDLDRFKQVNDRAGHEAGDELLRAVGPLLAAHLRDGDVVARWGGEEFVALLPGLELPAALEVAERLRLELQAHSFPRAGRATASFGVAQARAGESPRELMHRADVALYAAKRGGRNRVETAAA